MKKYLKSVPFGIQTINMPEVRQKAQKLLKQLEFFNNCKDNEEAVKNFDAVCFKPFKDKMDEIIKNY